MKFHLTNQLEANKAFAHLVRLTAKKAVVDIKRVSPSRSLSQNAYIHLTFGIFGLETGYTAHEAKLLYKRYANTDLYFYEKNGVAFLRSSADLTTAGMSASIDKWRKWAAEQEVNIPPPADKEALKYWENRIEQEGHYL